MLNVKKVTLFKLRSIKYNLLFIPDGSQIAWKLTLAGCVCLHFSKDQSDTIFFRWRHPRWWPLRRYGFCMWTRVSQLSIPTDRKNTRNIFPSVHWELKSVAGYVSRMITLTDLLKVFFSSWLISDNFCYWKGYDRCGSALRPWSCACHKLCDKSEILLKCHQMPCQWHISIFWQFFQKYKIWQPEV